MSKAAGAGLRGLKRARPEWSEWSSISMSLANLSLANTLPVGQSFLWHRHSLPDATEEYSRAVTLPDSSKAVVCLRQSPTELLYTAIHPTPEATAADKASGMTRAWIRDYFQLDRYPDLPRLYDQWRSNDPDFFAKVELNQRAVGVRVLRQDPWECLVAFITSTNNHISRITSLLHRFSEKFSFPLMTLDNPDGSGETVYYHFPRAQDVPLDGLESVLRDMGFGYRAGFFQSTFKVLRAKSPGPVEEELMRWRSLHYLEARANLLELKGVGRKVADCVLLMSMDQPHIIPIDTHIYSVATRHPSFPSRLARKPWSSALYEDVQLFLSDAWGTEGGWAQAVVFASDLKPQTPKKVKVKTEVAVDRKPPVKRLNFEVDSVADPPVLKRTRSRTKAAMPVVKVEVKEEKP